MRPEILQKLNDGFGHATFRPGQEQVIHTLLDGRSALAIFPTGGGKSLCYQLPAILLDGLTIVISPLIALMKDQVDALSTRGISAGRLDSTLTAAESANIFQRINDGSLKLLYVAPERLANETFVSKMRSFLISLVAIDEAHCISEWGHNFRPDYLRLAKIVRKWKVKRVLALTATASPEVARSIAKEFRIGRRDRIITSFHRENLFLQVTPAVAERRELLAEKLREEQRFPAIVYATLQETTENVAAYLQKSGIRARAYHAGLSDDVRTEVQRAFMLDEFEVIVATIAFGMGVDKSNVRSVYHFNLPKTLENYQQEIGRAGRDGQPSHCELLACGDDIRLLENFTLGNTPTLPALQQLMDHLMRQGQMLEISRYELSRVLDLRQLVLETALTYLEKDKVIEPCGSFYTKFEITFCHGEERVSVGHLPAQRQFLIRLLATGARRGRKLTITIEAAEEQLGESREKILRSLALLEESGDIVLIPKGIRHRYRILQNVRPAELAGWLHGIFVERETAELSRLKAVVGMAESGSCITRRLLKHFGESLSGNCGHCQNCLIRSARKKLPRSRIPKIGLQQIAIMQRLAEEKLPALRSARQLAKFLCGLTSPATQRDRLTRHDHFGSMAGYPFADVLDQTTSMLIE